MRIILAAVVTALAVFTVAQSAVAGLHPGNVKYTKSEIQQFFQNSGNPYLQQNAAAFADMSYRVESGGGNSAIYNGCCTGLMQMHESNITKFCQCTAVEYAALSGQEQINIYGKYFGAMSSETAMKQLTQMQAAGQTIGGQPVDAYTLSACAQLGGPKCLQQIQNGCGAEGADANGMTLCKFASKARGGSDGSGAPGGGSGTCLAAQPVQDPVIFSDYGAWNRARVSNGKNGWHRGVDIWPKAAQGSASKGKPIFAAHAGTVGTFGGSATKVMGADFITMYEHSWSRPDKRQVRAGEEIVKIGDRGADPHLHLEVMVKGSAISNATCSLSGSKDDCVFPDNSGKRDPGAMASMEKIKAASPNSWFRVNPERYLPSRVPLQGNATARTGRSESLPNTCTPGDGTAGGGSNTPSAAPVSERPVSASETGTAASTAASDGSYLSGNMGGASVVADMDQRSVMIDLARQAALDIRTRGSLADNLSSQFDSSIAHMLVLEARRAEAGRK